MKFARRKPRRAIAGIVATVIMFAILFTVGTSYFIFVNSQNASYVSSLLSATNKVQGSLAESLSISTVLESNGDVGFYANNTSAATVNMTAALVISSTGSLLRCVGIGFPAGAGCANTAPTLWVVVNAGKGTVTFDTGYLYVAGTTDTVKVLTARGNTYSATYPEPASQSSSSQSVTVNLDNLKWVQLIPQSSSLVQKNYVANCNAANCALAYNSNVAAGNILVAGIGWANHAPPSTPTDTRGDSFTLGASQSVGVASTPALVQSKYTSNCNAASCGLAFTSNVGQGNTLVYAVGWANQSPPSAPTDTRGDSFTLGASQSVTVNPISPAVVQHKYLANCNSATCALAYTSSVTAGNTLVFGLGWPSNQQYAYVPVTITNCASCLPALTVDGSATGSFTSASSGTVTLTTSDSNDIIVVMVEDEDTGNAVLRTVSSVAASGLTFAHRSSGSINSSPYTEMEVWYAAASTPLSSVTITATLSGSIDDASLVAFGVNGANTASPWDSNGALPKTATGTASGNPTVTAVSTSNANDILLGFTGLALAGAGTPAVETAASGYTLIQTQVNGGGTGASEAAAEYKVVSATQSSISMAFATANTNWIMTGDAIQQATSAATPNPFQQMVTWDPATYSTYEATNLGNVRFCSDSACNTPLNAWLESCSSTCSTSGSSSTSATAWVKLTSSIAGNGGTLTIYMVFEATSVNFDDNYWGEAPQLSGTYAQYDNGANVFTDYWNFAGTSCPTGWTCSGTTINNGLSAAASSSYAYTSATYGLTARILDFYGNMPTATSTHNAGFGYVHDTPNGPAVMWTVDDNTGGFGCGSTSDCLQTGTSASLYSYLTSLTTTGTQVYSIYWGSSSSATAYYAYSNSGSSYSNIPSAALSLGIYNAQGSQATLGPFNWLRDRVYPPSGVMPSTSSGSLTSGTGSPTSIADTLGDSFTLGVSQSAVSGSTAYESSIWYATASSSGSDTITATFTAAIAGSVSIYEIAGYSTAGVLSSSSSSTGGSTSASVGSFTPNSNSFAVGNVETGSSLTKYTVGAGYTTVASGAGGCDASDASQGCNEYETGLGSATTTPFTLSASTPWVDVAMSFTPLTASTYYSYMWYATVASSGADTVTAAFGSAVAGSVSIYEVSGVTATGLLTSTSSSSASQAGTSVTSMTPGAGSVVLGNAETTSTTYTAGSGYTLSGSCSPVTGCGEYQTGVGSATTVPISISPSAPWVEAALAFAPIVTTYYSYIWYATVGTAGADTITAAFGTTVAGSVSIYELNGFTTSGALSSTGISSSGSTTSAVSSFTPPSDSFTVGNTEGASGSTTYTATSGFTLVGTCNSVGGCSEYNAGGGGSSSTVPLTLGSSTGWVESAMSFSTPFNPQSGIQVGGYPTMGVPSGASLVWEVTFTNVDPLHRAITIWPQTEMAIGSAEFDGFDIDYTQAHYYIIDGLNAGSTTVNAYTSTTGHFFTLAYNIPTTLYFAATAALGSTTQAFGTNVLTPFEAYFALTGIFSDGTLFGETIPYPYGIITQANAYTTPTAGATAATVTVSCTSPCHFTAGANAMVGWINSAGQLTQLTTFTMSGSGNIPAGVTFQVPSAAAGYYTIEVTDYINSVFMTFQHT